jgi:hypothetical protein
MLFVFSGGEWGGRAAVTATSFLLFFVANAVTDCWVMEMIYSPNNS